MLKSTFSPRLAATAALAVAALASAPRVRPTHYCRLEQVQEAVARGRALPVHEP